MVRDRGRAVGIEGLHPHRFRHTWAHVLKLAGAPPEVLKSLGGWRSDQMLHRYGASAAGERAIVEARRLNVGDRI